MSQMNQTAKQNKSKPLNIVQAIMDNLLLIIVTLIVGIISVVSFALYTHKPYYSVSANMIFRPHIPELVYKNNERNLNSFEDWMRTQSHEIESTGVLSKAIRELEEEGIFWKHKNESDKTATDRLRARLDISQINNTQIVTISLGSREKHGLAEMVNKVVEKYIEHKDLQRKEQDQKKLNHLRKERDKYGKRLEKAYQDLMQISRKYATAVADEKNLYIYLNMFMDLRSRYNQVLTKRIETENKLTALENQKIRLKDLEIYYLSNTQLLLEMEQEIRSKMVGLNPESQQYSEYAEMISDISQKNIESARKYLISEIDKEINHQKMLNESARNSQLDLKKELNKAQIEVMEFNTAVLRASTQRQEIERIIDIWNRINQRIEQIEIELFNPGRVHILTMAQVPDFPDPDKLTKKILLGIIAVFGLALGIAILREILDKRVKRVADIEHILGFPASGFLLDSNTENILPEAIFNLHTTHPDSFMAELYNQLAVRIETEHREHGSKSFAMCSLKGQSGVTTVACNILAMIDAPVNKKILVDLNTRHPLNEQFDYYKNYKALNSVLLNTENFNQSIGDKQFLENCIIRDEQSKFDVLPLGGLKEFSMGRIQPSMVHQLLSMLNGQYEYIFIETPAMLLSSNTQTIVQKTDVSMIIVDAQKDTWPELIRAVGLLEKLRVSVISIILNKIKLMRAGYINQSIKEFHNKNVPLLADTNAPMEMANG